MVVVGSVDGAWVLRPLDAAVSGREGKALTGRIALAGAAPAAAAPVATVVGLPWKA